MPFGQPLRGRRNLVDHPVHERRRVAGVGILADDRELSGRRPARCSTSAAATCCGRPACSRAASSGPPSASGCRRRSSAARPAPSTSAPASTTQRYARASGRSLPPLLSLGPPTSSLCASFSSAAISSRPVIAAYIHAVRSSRSATSRIGAVRQQHARDVGQVRGRRLDQRRPAVAVLHVDVGAAVEQQRDRVDAVLARPRPAAATLPSTAVSGFSPAASSTRTDVGVAVRWPPASGRAASPSRRAAAAARWPRRAGRRGVGQHDAAAGIRAHSTSAPLASSASTRQRSRRW